MLLKKERYPHVFSPVQVGPITMKNRLGFAPMVCNQCDIDGTVTDAMVDFVAGQADTGVGYVTIGDTQVDDERGGAFMSTLNIARRSSVPGLIRLNEAARYHGAVLSVELNHSGRGAKDYLIDGPALAPSAIPLPGCAKHIKEMDEEDLETVKCKFVNCAKNCVRGEFKMLMLHCAHNNMMGQFLSPLSNRRTDRYGGSPENRRRYPIEVLRAIREAVGDNIAIEIRVSATEMSPGGLEFAESLAFMEEAQEYCDLIHVSRGIVYNEAGVYTLPTFLRDRRLNVEWARQVKQRVHKPVAVVGNFSTLDEVEEVIASGAADIVCMARAYLADAQMVHKCLAGHPEEVRPCLRCHRGCIDNSARGKAIHCAVNPALGFEPEIRMMRRGEASPEVFCAQNKESAKQKHFLVVGGGPAGMTAAQTLAQAGHDVTLCEKSDRLGGLLIDAAAPACKEYMKNYLDWIIAETYRSGVRVLLHTEVTPQMPAQGPGAFADERRNSAHPEVDINMSSCGTGGYGVSDMPGDSAAVPFDAVLVGTGSDYLHPPIEGMDLPHVVMLHDADEHPESLAHSLVICGGGSSGLETALSLAREGHDVTVVDQLPIEKFANGMPYFPRLDLMQELEAAGVKLMPQMRIVRFVPEGIELETTKPLEMVDEAQAVAEEPADDMEEVTDAVEELHSAVKSGVEADGIVGKTVGEFLPADQCVIALGVRKNTALLDALRAEYAEGIYPIGDCEGGSNIYDATHTAYFAALRCLQEPAAVRKSDRP